MAKAYKSEHCGYDVQECVKELKRELAMRKQVYPDQIKRGKLDRDKANQQWKKVKDAIHYLELLDKIQTPNQAEMYLNDRKRTPGR